jgi:5-methylcytosine-specific restriction endonuclease McrA
LAVGHDDDVADDGLLIERLLRVIDEGRRTATYKLALLLALIDAAAVSDGATELPTRSIAAQVLALYYPQTRLYVANDGIERELRQISMKSSPPLRAALRLRLHGDAADCRSAHDAAVRIPDEYERALDAVEDTFVRYPIPLLQVVGRQLVPFLYHADWEEGTTVASLRRRDADRVRLLPGVADRLVVLGPMLRPLIELHWTSDVARWTGVNLEDEALRTHLFGTERVTFPARLVAGVHDLQDGNCFYCGDRISGRGQVDHFLAWSRWPNDAVENLVLADRCNGAKSDHLSAVAHLERWATRLDEHGANLSDIAASTGWRSDPARTRALVATTYSHLSPGTPLWVHGSTFEIASGPVRLRDG